MEYFFDLNKKNKDENKLILLIYSIIFHCTVLLGVALIILRNPSYTTITVSTNTIQLAAKGTNSNKQTIQKHQDKKIPMEELVKSTTKKQSIHKEIPLEKTPPKTQAKDIANPTPEGQSSNANKEFFSAEIGRAHV